MNVLIYGSPFVLVAFIICISLLLEKEYPSSIQKTNKGKMKDSYTVSVVAVAGIGSATYLDFIFTKRRNGKYRLRFGIFDWVIAIVCVVPTVALCGWIINDFWDKIFNNPIEMTSYAIVIILDILLLLVLLCNPIMRAIILFKRFKRFEKNLKKQR